MRLFLLLFLLALDTPIRAESAVSFSQLVQAIEEHASVQELQAQANKLQAEGQKEGSWGDPSLKLAAKNFPKDTLRDDQTPMTGIEVGVAQKIALSNKYGKIEHAFELMAEAKKMTAIDQKRFLIKSLWEILIRRRMLRDKEQVLAENLSWIGKMLRISKKLYANGRVSQQALLELQIRKSELESNIASLNHELLKTNYQIGYLSAQKIENIRDETVPWKLLIQNDSSIKDYKELAMKSMEESSAEALSAAKLNYIPDVTISAGYTKRANIDQRGDFVGLTLSFPLPISGKKYGNHSEKVFQHTSAKRALKNYQQKKKSEIFVWETEIDKLNAELDVLRDRTLKFARNSRDITSKSYGLGNSNYIELLQSELKLQNLELQRIELEKELALGRVQLKYVRGDQLYEN